MSNDNWNEVWREKMIQNQISYRNIHWSQRWNDDQSVSYFHKHMMEMEKNSINLVSQLPTGKNLQVLEIGPGAGPITIPLSSVVGSITAIEPSLHMGKKLEENLHKNNISNVSIIQKRWEDIDQYLDLQGPYDLVLASHSLGMNDIKSALHKMNQVSSKFVYLFWFLQSSFMEQQYIKLWPIIHGTDFSPLPKADLLCQILKGMDIHPNFEPFETENIYRYDSLDQAVTDFSQKFGIFDDDKKEIILKFICDYRDPDTHEIVIRGKTSNAKIWWEK